MQTKRSSLEEAVLSTLIGFSISFTIQQYMINPLWDLHVTVFDNLAITGIFTVASIARSYVMRRFYNWRIMKGIA